MKKTIDIVINEKSVRVNTDATVSVLLKNRSISKGAVWVNGVSVKRNTFSEVTFDDGDDVIILRA